MSAEENPNFHDSEESPDIPEPPSSSKPGAKRRASRAGTRSVASLTPEQLARKRANDREAQRSIRQRTKNHIEDLEQRIRELSGEEETQSIEDVKRRNAELEEELKHLRETLRRSEGSVTSSPELAPLSTVVQRIFNAIVTGSELTCICFEARYGMNSGIDMIDSPYSYSPQWSSPGRSSLSSSPFTVSSAGELITSLAPDYSMTEYGFSDPGSARSDTLSPSLPMADMGSTPPQVTPAINRRAMPFNPRPHFGRSRSYPNGRLGQPAWQPSVSSSMSSSRMTTAMSGMPPEPSLIQPMAPTSNPSGLGGDVGGMGPPPPTSNRLVMERNVGASPMQPALAMNSTIPEMAQPVPRPAQSSLAMNGNLSEINPLISRHAQDIGYDTPSSFVNQPLVHTWELPLRFVPPTGPIDSILIGLLQRQRNMALEGVTGTDLTGPFHPDVRGLLSLEDSASTYPIASVLVDLVRRIALKGLAEKAAMVYLIYRLTQWQISPSPETYNNLPDWYGPRASQLMTGHPIWLTLMIWGKLRDIVINDQGKYATDEFQHLYASSLNVNWPYRDQDIVVFEGEEVRLTDGFVRHVNVQSNWSLDEPFQMRYPELQPACKFTELPGQQAQSSMQNIKHQH
ncbi:uncharacterized protein PAC_09728 [Phialocephala subalpina]|uniref:BZIP transcription factor n=1 Tax=Phialocephala subalpina TaxID=576137 RepID=A0A1L7X489_9HELO|nr:uncharacterized protein PAC_09728 [Phialocephala subalpina]